jgi:hypothetical protein
MSTVLERMERRLKLHQEKAEQAKKDLEAYKEKVERCNNCKAKFNGKGFRQTGNDLKLCVKCFDNTCVCGMIMNDRRIFAQVRLTKELHQFCGIECSSYQKGFNDGFLFTDAYIRL